MSRKGKIRCQDEGPLFFPVPFHVPLIFCLSILHLSYRLHISYANLINKITNLPFTQANPLDFYGTTWAVSSGLCPHCLCLFHHYAYLMLPNMATNALLQLPFKTCDGSISRDYLLHFQEMLHNTTLCLSYGTP